MKKGSILLSLLIIIGVVLTTTLSLSTQAIFLLRSSHDYYKSLQAGYAADSLLYNTIQQYMRFGEGMENQYSEWTDNCLQVNEWVCKMEIALNSQGGLIDVWGQYGGKVKHRQAVIETDLSGQIQVVNFKEIY